MKKGAKNGISKSKIVAVGAGLATIGAGAYYLFGPNAKIHKKKATALLSKMKTEAIREVKKAKEVGIPAYHKAVDAVSKNYAKQYKLHEKDVKAISKKLKGEWKTVSKMVKKTAKNFKK